MSNENQPKRYPQWLQIVLGIVTLGLYYLLRPSYTKKSVSREWTDAILFAVIAATIIRTFFIEAFTIPTSSMEKTLLIGDFLFVSKMSYGPRIPNTPLSFPFAHHTLPFTTSTKSYLEWIKLPYMRLPGFGDIKNNDIVVFNYPMEDFRPVDKQENYIKRCVAIPGDSLEVKQSVLFVNGKAAMMPERMQVKYHVKTDGSQINPKALSALGITLEDQERSPLSNQGDFGYPLLKENVPKLRGFSNIHSVEPMIERKGEMSDMTFPHDPLFSWNADNYGPIWVPKEGATVKLSLENLSLYKRIIEVYEGNKLEVKDTAIYINDKASDSYTFKMDYYFMMGDNRHNSADSRFWGFVPIDHIVGKAVFVWLSLDNEASSFFSKIRWDRVFVTINENGVSSSYFPYALIIGLAFWGYGKWKKKKKKVEEAKE